MPDSPETYRELLERRRRRIAASMLPHRTRLKIGLVVIALAVAVGYLFS